jgi:nucleoside-diphosphate-sugar epimerase
MKALVTGGGGFLGKAIVTRLLNRGDDVVSLARGEYPQLEAMGVRTVRGCLTDRNAVREAARDCDVVFHVAAKASVDSLYEEFRATNVNGTRHVIQACRELGIKRLVYTSTPSVIHGGGDIRGADESIPYPAEYVAYYPMTKAEAERMVLAANDKDLATVALRPHVIWGPGDNNLVPRLIQRAKAGRAVKVKGGPHLVDTVYVDNAAHAHILAADRLAPGSQIAGKVYFISNGEPIDMADLMDRILALAGLPPVKRQVSAKTLHLIGRVLELLYRTFAPHLEPPVNRFVAHQLSTSHWFDISAARRDLGYEPEISIEEGLRLLAKHLSQA